VRFPRFGPPAISPIGPPPGAPPPEIQAHGPESKRQVTDIKKSDFLVGFDKKKAIPDLISLFYLIALLKG
jgi:hypothetical protein